MANSISHILVGERLDAPGSTACPRFAHLCANAKKKGRVKTLPYDLVNRKSTAVSLPGTIRMRNGK